MRAVVAAAAVTISVFVASGCAGSHPADSPTTSVPRLTAVARTTAGSATGPLVVPLSASVMRRLDRHLNSPRFLSPTRLAIPGILGSSNCPSVPDKLIVRSPHAIRIKLVVGRWGRTASGIRVRVPHRPRICLTDLVLKSAVVISIDPRQIDVHHELKVSLYYPKFVIPRFKRPVVDTVPPLATARIGEEVRVARSSNPRLFSIFPAVPGKRPCVIPESSPSRKRYGGICQTSVHPRPTHEPSVSVSFTESWEPNCPLGASCALEKSRLHTWRIIEGEPIIRPGAKLHVYATHSNGATAPQDR